MSKVYRFRSDEVRYEEASLWIERLSEGLTTEEERDLQAWLETDHGNRDVLEKMARLWDKMDSLERLSVLVPHSAVSVYPGQGRRPYVAAAACLLLGISIFLLSPGFIATQIGQPTTQRAEESFYETDVGEQRVIELEDGTEIALNTSSRIGVRYTSQARLLSLEAGEAHIVVVKDPQRPLSVLAGDQVVQAVGTAFNVEIKPDKAIELVVTEGKVRIGEREKLTDSNGEDLAAALPASAVLVSAGQEIVMGHVSGEVKSISAAEIEVKLSWREGSLVFRGESLSEVLQEVERYTGMEFVVVDDKLKAVRVSGFFKAGDVDGMLAVLKANFNIEYQHVSASRVLLYAGEM
ncbi:FecR domain-containing protein [Haliea sp.]|jgi:transmembrane sensor|uniref:FecR family protein n=1 Tax=Haliea sp. TaxID=1932666 RepID=UPI000C428244|nr:FecR domain-containing protein [Haliea sp.]MAD61946.1 hypothetical protein [Haliea sp.]MAY91667.1 hypothetical protein [Haliea sp.]MBP69122.1 hypothetical protein [Haliea sp.]|tara:strand:+ start:21460 stop:22509 length:1050 start_codon:yes stop_codon:yes gene_type:complete